MIDIRKLKELVRLMVENDLSEINLQDQQETVQVKRGAAGVPIVMSGATQVAVAPAASRPVISGEDASDDGEAAAPAASPAAAAASSEAGLVPVVSPMVGTFYTAPKPEDAPFVSVGSVVSPDTTVCLAEAMKVFNEVKAGVSGTIVKILVSNGQPIEYGTKLFLVRPS
jgi:acetyl-CoA carboxylase biotin carboxyl carrier protein